MGVMPNLRAIIDDAAGRHARRLRARQRRRHRRPAHRLRSRPSPDVILRPAPVADPQAAYGEGSGTENSNTLGFEAEAGQDNSSTCACATRAARPPAQPTATVYWSPVVDARHAGLVDPRRYRRAARACPPGEVLTVSDADHLAGGRRSPATGHYCLVAHRSAPPATPAPPPADFAELRQLPAVHPREQQRHLAQLQRRRQRSGAGRRPRRLRGAALRGGRRPGRGTRVRGRAVSRVPGKPSSCSSSRCASPATSTPT